MPSLLGVPVMSGVRCVGAFYLADRKGPRGSEFTDDDERVIVTLAANGFLVGMVRAVVGTLLEIASGKRDLEEMEKILAARDRRAAGETAPARGLFLARVEYPEGQ